MALTVTIRFDDTPHRQAYRVRFRTAGYDRTRNVPRDVFKEAGVDSKKESDRARKIAERWAYDTARTIEAELAPTPAADARDDTPRMRLSAVAALVELKNPNDVGPLTRRRHREMSANVVRILGDPFADEVDDSMALDYRNRRSREADPKTGEPIRNRTIKNELTHLKAVVTYGYQWRKETGMQVLQLFKLPLIRKQAGYEIHLRDDELLRLFMADFDHDTARWRLVIAFGLVTMLRVKVLMNFDDRWFDERRQWMTIPAEVMKGAGGEKRALSVPVCDLAVQIIRSAILLRRARTHLVFANFKGRASKWPIQSVRRVCAEHDIRYFTAHDLRRTGMTVLEESGVSPFIIARLVGHSTTSTTARDQDGQTAPRVTSSYIGVREDHRLRSGIKQLDAFWEHLRSMNPNISLTCPQDVTRGPRGPYRKRRQSTQRKVK